jgi:hypothetical protein
MLDACWDLKLGGCVFDAKQRVLEAAKHRENLAKNMAAKVVILV